MCRLDLEQEKNHFWFELLARMENSRKRATYRQKSIKLRTKETN